tara:strand:+ start:11575 stop:12336 length:762 start_codon:yes stop_codon:yes gene_type:complete
MQYFNDFNKIFYKFGDEVDTVVYQDLSQYTDIVDQVKDGISFLNFHTIQEGFRPDQVSLQLYGTPLNYWTFYLLNDDIREQGWPLTNVELNAYIRKIFPNTVLNTRQPFATKLKVGQTITGAVSGATGVILKRNLDLGQIVIDGISTFKSDGELINSTNADGVIETVQTISAVNEYQSASHYVNGSGEIVDLGVDSDTTSPNFGGLLPPGSQITEKTHEDVYFTTNENLRQIKVIKPNIINNVISSFKKSIRS